VVHLKPDYAIRPLIALKLSPFQKDCGKPLFQLSLNSANATTNTAVALMRQFWLGLTDIYNLFHTRDLTQERVAKVSKKSLEEAESRLCRNH